MKEEFKSHKILYSIVILLFLMNFVLFDFLIYRTYMENKIQNLVFQNKDSNNYKLEIKTSDTYSETPTFYTYQYKNGICKSLSSDRNIVWVDFTKNQMIQYREDNTLALTGSSSFSKPSFNNLLTYFSKNFSFSYLGKENCQGKHCFVIKFISLNSSKKKENYEKFWIDCKTGIPIQKETFCQINSNTAYQEKSEYTVTFDVVTDKDVKKPDLSNYTVKIINK